jgi:hypothetical protein
MSRIDIAAIGALFLATLAACGGTPKTDPRYPPREPGCAVKVYKGEVPSSTRKHDIGRVEAICTTDVSESDCMRTLMDEVCKLGGDIVWDVPQIPEQPTPDKLRWVACAAHTKASKASQ